MVINYVILDLKANAETWVQSNIPHLLNSCFLNLGTDHEIKWHAENDESVNHFQESECIALDHTHLISLENIFRSATKFDFNLSGSLKKFNRKSRTFIISLNHRVGADLTAYDTIQSETTLECALRENGQFMATMDSINQITVTCYTGENQFGVHEFEPVSEHAALIEILNQATELPNLNLPEDLAERMNARIENAIKSSLIYNFNNLLRQAESIALI